MAGRDTNLAPGVVFDGKYELQQEIGAGSFGRVFSARQLSTGQVVAVKVVRFPDDLSAEAAQRLVERFQREALLSAELSHPNLVALLDTGEGEHGESYVVFEHVPGASLADVLANEGRCKPREALRLMTQVLDALAAAHRVGIVHRDVKPSNIMVSGTGALRNAKLLDLGMGGFAESRRDQMLRVTQSQEFVGTPAYAAPELLYGSEASPHSDLYAWGLVCIEVLTGEHPFVGSRGTSILSSPEVKIPEALAGHRLGDLLARVTRADPKARDLDADELVHALEALDVADLERRLGHVTIPRERAERRQLTILSCRLEIDDGEALDIEERDALLRDAHAVCAAQTERHGGNLASKIGDRVIQHFGLPVAHESDARRAARAALAIIGEMARLEQRHGLPARVHVHCGLHTGPVIARELRTVDGRPVSEVVGKTPEVATHLDGIAGPGEIVLSDTTRRLVEPVLASVSIGKHEVHELSGHTQLYRLLPEAEGHASLDEATRFVGRGDELAQLRSAWQRACEGQARCVVLRGEPGIGKSRLVRELRAQLGADVRWIDALCLEESTDAPLHPAIDLLRDVGEPIASLLERTGHDVATTAPLFEHRLGVALESHHPRPNLTPERENQILIETLAGLLIATSLDEPTVLVLEDLHWADPSTQGLLNYLIAAMRQDPARQPRLLLLFTTRGWAPEDASVVALPPLTRNAIVELVHSGLDASIEPALLDLIVVRSDGVPLFVEEVTRDLRGARPRRGTADAIPDSLAGLLQARLDVISAEARETTQMAAAFGREFEEEHLRAACRDVDAATIGRHLAELLREGFLLSRPTPRGQRYVFRHVLIREAAYDTMLRSKRRQCHDRIARTLQRDFPKVVAEEPQILALHLGEAGHHEEAAEVWHRAGLQALARAAYQEAISRFQKGLAGLETLSESSERLRREVVLLESMGMAYYSSLGYGAPQVEETFARAQAICDQLGADVPLQTLYGVWGVRFTQGDVDATAAIVSRLRQLARSSDEPLAALYAHGTHGLRAALLGELDTADEELARSTAECEAPGRFQHIQALPYGGPVHPPAWWSWVLCWRGDVDRARTVRERMRKLDDRLGNVYGHAVAGHFGALVAQELDDVDEARTLIGNQLAFTAEQQILLWLFCAQHVHGWVMARDGSPAEGIAAMEQALAMLQAVGFCSAKSTFLARLAEAKLLAGDHAGGLASVEEGLAMAETTLDRYYGSQLHRIGARIRQAMGELGAAERGFEEAIRVAHAQGARWFELQAATDLARQLGEAGRRDEGRRRLGEVLARIDEGADTRPVAAARELVAELR
jgi:TOMM system kinase/cyclase fusion protein